MENVYEATSSNKRKSNLILVGFLLFVAVTVYFFVNIFTFYLGLDIGFVGIFGLALIVSGVSGFIGYYYSDRIVLSISSAKPATKEEYFDLYSIVENISIATGLPMPKVYVMQDPAPNAFATGRDPNNAVICVTTGLLEKLDRTELEGVVAHEFAHIRNYDIRLVTLVAVLVGTVALMADILLRVKISGGGNRKGNGTVILFVVGILFAILAPVAGKIIQMAISRRREYMADATAVHITRQPSGLANALIKIKNSSDKLRSANKATAHLFISNPFDKHIIDARNRFSGLFQTHPPIDDRIAALRRMGADQN